jgi:hypothetical protein
MTPLQTEAIERAREFRRQIQIDGHSGECLCDRCENRRAAAILRVKAEGMHKGMGLGNSEQGLTALDELRAAADELERGEG